MQKLKVAVMDMYDGTENLGMPSILDVISKFDNLDFKVYDVRGKCEIPTLEYDIYISTGGPGSPLEGDGIWDRAYYFFLDKMWKHNQRSDQKKFAFFICHSFQMVTHFLSLADVVLRHKPSIGVLSVRKVEAGLTETVFTNLEDPFFVGDFRAWQVIQPNRVRIKNMGCQILALEKERPHVDLERAIMAIRYSDEWIGTQFHPEADPEGMLIHFERADIRAQMIEKKGEAGLQVMLENAKDPHKLKVTFEQILPTFLRSSIEAATLQAFLNMVQ